MGMDQEWEVYRKGYNLQYHGRGLGPDGESMAAELLPNFDREHCTSSHQFASYRCEEMAHLNAELAFIKVRTS